MPIDINTINHQKTLKNIRDLQINLEEFNDIKQLREYIRKELDKKRVKKIYSKRLEALMSTQPISEMKVNLHLQKSIDSHNLNINDFKTKGELLTKLKQLSHEKFISNHVDKVNEKQKRRYRTSRETHLQRLRDKLFNRPCCKECGKYLD